ncbi:MAG: helicase-related protein, partial [Nocardioidaceae bacterium]
NAFGMGVDKPDVRTVAHASVPASLEAYYQEAGRGGGGGGPARGRGGGGAVVARLGLREPLRVATGFYRPNVSFAVARPAAHEKRPLLIEALGRDGGLPAIVYAGTRAGAEDIAADLSAALGEEALPYHAGLERERRASVQRAFLADDVRLVVATNAFGMGVDKPDVRTVAHASVPASLEAYYQEAGRAGRDGRPALALLLAENRDKALHVHFIRRDELADGLPGWLADRMAAAADGDGRYVLDGAVLARDLGVDGDRVRALVGHLTRAGVVAPAPAGPDTVAGRLTAPFDARAAARCRASIEEAARARWRQYREIWAYVEGRSCRRRAILRHFGDHSAPAGDAVGCCDACDPALRLAPPPPAPVELGDLDDAIVSVARMARPAVGRTTCAEILHGARTQKIARNSYDGLPAYGCSAHLRRTDILARVDRLIDDGRLVSSGGAYPVLRAAG